MKRWPRRILIALPIVIVVAVVATQLVLWSDYPRRLVLGIVQRQLGLRVDAKTLTTGWFGSTTLRDVTVSLPLADASFLTMPTMEVEHTSLIPLLVTQKFELDGIELNEPNLVVRRDASGRWNLQDVAELLAKAGGGGAAEPGTKKRPPKLPRLRLVDGTITVVERDGAKAVIAPLNVTGDPQGPLVYKYDAQVPDRFRAVGQVAPGENFKHEVELFAAPGDWLTPWMKQPPAPLLAKARWTGEVNDGRVIGRLAIDEAKVDQFAARGRVAVQAGPGSQAVINPQDLVVTTEIPAVPKVQLASGALEVNGSQIRARQVHVSALGGTAQLDASGDLSTKSGELVAQWFELPAPGQVQHAGTFKANLRTPFPGGPEVGATLVTRGGAPQGRWDGEIHVNGAGRSWTDMVWALNVQRLAWQADPPVVVENFSARIAHRGDQVTLQRVEWPGHPLFAEGQYDHAAKQWFFRAGGRGTPSRAVVSSPAARTEIEFAVDARGDAKQVTLNQLFLRARELDAKLSGKYVFHLPKPVDLNFNVTHVPRPPEGEGTDQPPIRGRLLAGGRITGTQSPLKLDVAGDLRARDLAVFGREYGDIHGKIVGDLTAISAQFKVHDLKLLGGRWEMTSVWPYAGEDRLVGERNPIRAKITAEGLQLAELGNLLGTPLDGGDARGEWVVDIPFPRPRPETVAMTGSFRAADVVVGGGDAALRADEVIGHTTLVNGLFRADPVTLRRADRDVRGIVTIAAQTTVADPQRPTVVVDAKTWPVKIGADGLAAVTAETNLSIDARTKSATGPIAARASFATTQRAIGEAELDGRVDGRTILLDRVTADAIGGQARGSGTIPIDDPNRATLTMSWSGIAGERLADLFPQLRGLSGEYAGALAVSPATAQRALEPLRVTLGVNPSDGKFNALEIGPMRLSAFVNLRPDFSVERFVLDELPSEIRTSQRREAELDERGVPVAERPLGWNDIRLADGRIRVWGRRARHGAADAVQSHVIADFTRLDIDQLVHAVKPDADPMPGRLGGSITLHGNPRQPDLVLGEGRLEITESDLGNIDALALLYNLTRVGQSASAPIGSGSLNVTLQASTLSLQNIRYFNRGVQARASSIDIGNVWAGPDASIFGYIVGSARPLRDLKLPLLADVDAILNVVQSDLATVKVEGTVGDPKPSPALFNEAGDALKRFIVGEVNTEARGRPVAK